MALRSRKGRLVLLGAGALGAALLVPTVANAATAKANWGNFDRSGVGFNTLQPSTVTVSKGDKVTFTILGFHTVVIPKKGAKTPDLTVASATLNPVTNDPAGQPYWWSNVTPIVQVNVAAAAPSGGTVVNGRSTVNSGIIDGNAPKFSVTFSKVGTYTVRCAVHPRMRGTVKVLPTSGDTAKKRLARAAREAKAQLATVKALVKKADKAKGDVVQIGPGTSKAQIFSFHPAKKTVTAGTTVTFKMAGANELHTVTFGPKAYVDGVAKAFFPSSPANLNLGSETLYPTDPPPAGVPVVTPTAHGNGFVNSGALSDPGSPGPLPHRFSVTFPTPGTYQYSCLIHPEMRGTITVG